MPGVDLKRDAGQRVALAGFERDGLEAELAGEICAILAALDQREPDDLGIIGDLPIDIGRGQRGVPQSSYVDHIHPPDAARGRGDGASLAKLLAWRLAGRLQAEIFAQRLAFVFGAEQAAPLQFGDHHVDEIVEPAWQERRHDVEAVAAILAEPLFHHVGDGLRRAIDDRLGARAGDPRRHLADASDFRAAPSR